MPRYSDYEKWEIYTKSLQMADRQGYDITPYEHMLPFKMQFEKGLIPDVDIEEIACNLSGETLDSYKHIDDNAFGYFCATYGTTVDEDGKEHVASMLHDNEITRDQMFESGLNAHQIINSFAEKVFKNNILLAFVKSKKKTVSGAYRYLFICICVDSESLPPLAPILTNFVTILFEPIERRYGIHVISDVKFSNRTFENIATGRVDKRDEKGKKIFNQVTTQYLISNILINPLETYLNGDFKVLSRADKDEFLEKNHYKASQLPGTIVADPAMAYIGVVPDLVVNIVMPNLVNGSMLLNTLTSRYTSVKSADVTVKKIASK